MICSSANETSWSISSEVSDTPHCWMKRGRGPEASFLSRDWADRSLYSFGKACSACDAEVIPKALPVKQVPHEQGD